MNVSRTLSFVWTPASLAVSIVAVLVVAGLCFEGTRRGGYRPASVVLELLRLVIVCLVALLLNQPEWIEEFHPEGKPAVAVLWDSSPSMDTRDVIVPRPVGPAPMTRSTPM